MAFNSTRSAAPQHTDFNVALRGQSGRLDRGARRPAGSTGSSERCAGSARTSGASQYGTGSARAGWLAGPRRAGRTVPGPPGPAGPQGDQGPQGPEGRPERGAGAAWGDWAAGRPGPAGCARG